MKALHASNVPIDFARANVESQTKSLRVDENPASPAQRVPESRGDCRFFWGHERCFIRIIMQLPIQITFRGIPQSDAIDAYVRERAAKLEKLTPRITHCRVAIEARNHHSRALHYRVRV